MTRARRVLTLLLSLAACMAGVTAPALLLHLTLGVPTYDPVLLLIGALGGMLVGLVWIAADTEPTLPPHDEGEPTPETPHAATPVADDCNP